MKQIVKMNKNMMYDTMNGIRSCRHRMIICTKNPYCSKILTKNSSFKKARIIKLSLTAGTSFASCSIPRNFKYSITRNMKKRVMSIKFHPMKYFSPYCLIYITSMENSIIAGITATCNSICSSHSCSMNRLLQIGAMNRRTYMKKSFSIIALVLVY